MYQVTIIITLQFGNHIKQRATYVFLIGQCLHTLCLVNILIFYFSNDISFQPTFNFTSCAVRLHIQCCSTQCVTNCLGPFIFCYLSPYFVPVHTRNSKFYFCRYCVVLCLFRLYSLFPSTHIISSYLKIAKIQCYSLYLKVSRIILTQYFIVIIRNGST